jgi:hypothetical protein
MIGSVLRLRRTPVRDHLFVGPDNREGRGRADQRFYLGQEHRGREGLHIEQEKVTVPAGAVQQIPGFDRTRKKQNLAAWVDLFGASGRFRP